MGLLAILDCALVPRAAPASDPPGSDAPPLIEIVTTAGGNRDRLRIEALVTTERIRRVDFLLDGELVGRDKRFPFGAAIAAPTPTPGAGARLEGVAYDGDGRELARDSLRLDPGDPLVDLSLTPVTRLGRNGWLEVGASVDHPPDVDIERVDFYRDERYVASVTAAPYRVRIPATEESGYLRAVALTRGGELVEDVRLLGDPAGADLVSVGLVELYAIVTTRSGTPVRGLSRERFELRQGGLPRAIERFSEGDAVPLSLALVIDGSGSMLESLERAKRSASDFLQATLDRGDEALLVDFDSRPRLLHDRTDDVAGLVASFDDIRSRGGSAVYDAILFAALQLEAAPGRRALVVLTDGLDSGSRISPRKCAAAARLAGVPIFVLALGNTYETTPSHRRLALERLATASGGSWYPIRELSDVGDAYEAIETQLRGQYLLGFSTPAPLSSHELSSLSLDVADDRLIVRTILGGQVRVMD